MLQKQLGQRIADLRRAKNFTQVQIARKIGCSVEFISFVERGVNGPSVAGLERLTKALNVDVRERFAFGSRKE